MTRARKGLLESCRQLAVAVLGTSLALGSSGCAINPVTGSPEISFMSLEEEVEIGEEAAKQIESQLGYVKDEALIEYVEQVGARVAETSPRKDIPYRFYVLDLELPTAFAVPGGHIYLSRGLLALVNDEAELANLLGHEVGHIAARHASADSWRQATVGVLSGIGTIAGALIGLGGLSQAAGQGFLAAHSREQENQADEIGQTLAAQAGWDPLAMSQFLRALDRETILREEAVREASFFDSHPVTTERISTTRDRASKLQIARAETTPAEREEFLNRLQGLVLGQDPQAGVFVTERQFLHRDLNFRIRFPEDWATVNAPSYVGASDGAVKVELEYQGKSDDARKAAKEYLEQLEQKREEAIEKGERPGPEFTVEKSGPRLVTRRRTAYTVQSISSDRRITILQYFIPLPSGMYRVTCTVATPVLGTYERDCRGVAGSLRTLKKSDRERIERVTLQLARAEKDETLREFGDRVGNDWSVELTAAANGLSLPYDLKPGQLLKYARRQVYVPAEPDAGEAAPEDAGDAELDDEEEESEE